MTKTYQSTVEYDANYDEYRLIIPEELLDHIGWEEGDIVEWHLNKDGTILLERTDEEFFEGEEDGEG